MAKTKHSIFPEIVSVDRVQPAVYNPREADQMRLNFLRMSIAHLGFVLPLYATPDGHLLSGHQRLTVAKELGVTEVPVVWVDVPEAKWKQLNLLFNRGTNDMDAHESSEVFVNQLEQIDLSKAMAKLSKKKIGSDDFYPCMKMQSLPIAEMVEHATRPYASMAVAQCKRLYNMGVVMPVLRAERGTIINGNYRLYAGAEKAADLGLPMDYPAVTLSNEEAAVAEALVNLVSMRFTVERQFADMLRYGAYRRPENKVEDLVVAMRFWADGKKKRSAEQSLKEPARFWHGFRQVHGETICDFGAGQRRNGLILRKKGLTCVDWEPYPCDWQKITGDNADKPSLTLSRMVSNTFLDAIEQGVKFDSIFANAVLNSVPLHRDRMCVLAVMHACCSFHTGVYGTAKSMGGFKHHAFLPLNKIDADGNVHKGMQQSKFTVPYEAGTFLADISKAPKVQKHHTVEGMEQMLRCFFREVRIYADNTSAYMFFEAKKPKRVNPKVLRAALELEFDLPYPEGQSIGLADRALAVFSKRIGIDLTDPQYATEDKSLDGHEVEASVDEASLDGDEEEAA